MMAALMALTALSIDIMLPGLSGLEVLRREQEREHAGHWMFIVGGPQMHTTAKAPRELHLDARQMDGAAFDRGTSKNLGVGRSRLFIFVCRVDAQPCIDLHQWTQLADVIACVRFCTQGRVGSRAQDDEYIRSLHRSRTLPGTVTSGSGMSVEGTEEPARSEAVHDTLNDTGLLQAIIQNTPDAIVTIDSGSVIRSFNPAAEKLFGYAGDEAVGEIVKILMPSHFREQHDIYVANYLATGERRIVGIGRVVVGQHRDGSTFPIELFVSETTVNTGRIFIGFIRDLSDLDQEHRRVQELQSKLFHVSRLSEMGQLSSGLAHEINQPLASVVANGHACVRWLSHSPPNIAKALEAAERTVRDGKDAGEVVRRIRTLFKRTTAERVPVDIGDVVRDVLRFIEADATRRRVEVLATLEPQAPAVFGDRVQLQQVVLNLMLNALDAVDPIVNRPKQVAVRTRRGDAARVVVEIEDNGIGLDDPHAVFEPFYTTKTNGMGMGLAICRSIVTAHDGTLAVTRNDDFGTTFWFALPIENGASQ
jgi:two-component system sensor kinase FixL